MTTISTPLTLHRYRVKIFVHPSPDQASLVQDNYYIQAYITGPIFEGLFDFNPTTTPAKLHAIHDNNPSEPNTFIPHPETDPSGIIHMSTFPNLQGIINDIAKNESKPDVKAEYYRLSGGSFPTDFPFIRDPIDGTGMGGWVEAFTGAPSSIGYIATIYEFVREADVETTVEVVQEEETTQENDPLVQEAQNDVTTQETDPGKDIIPIENLVDPVIIVETPIVTSTPPSATVPTVTQDPYSEYMIADPCFPANTPITTDQGIIAIQNIIPNRHTINGNAIRHVTKTISTDDYLVCFKPHSLAVNVPSKKTFISPHHKIYYSGKLVDAHKFIGIKGVEAVAYSGEILYNILEDNYSLMKVNNIVCETLDPNNVVARLYNSNLGEEYKKKIISTANHTTKKRNIRAYSSVVNKL